MAITNSPNNYPVIVRVFTFSLRVYYKIIQVTRICFSGFWLGVLGRDALQLIDRNHYNSKPYIDENYNRKGFFLWEEKAIKNFFQKCRNILVIATGSGREVLALQKLGYDVDGFECNPILVKLANELFKKEGLAPVIKNVPYDHCPDTEVMYDGIIIGWGAYSHIQGKKQRIVFLKDVRSQLKKGHPVLLSFFNGSQDRRDIIIISKIANFIRRIIRRELVEIGDDLFPNYIHYFSREEIESELHEAGFGLEFFSTDEFGHAVGIAV